MGKVDRVHTTVYLTKINRLKIEELVSAGQYEYINDFINEAVTAHIRRPYAKLEIERARRIAEQEAGQ